MAVTIKYSYEIGKVIGTDLDGFLFLADGTVACPYSPDWNGAPGRVIVGPDKATVMASRNSMNGYVGPFSKIFRVSSPTGPLGGAIFEWMGTQW